MAMLILAGKAEALRRVLPNIEELTPILDQLRSFDEADLRAALREPA